MKPKSRKLKLFFNRGARQSATRQLIRASWLMPGFATWLGLTKESLIAFIVMMIGWVLLQVGAHFVLSIEEDPAKASTPQRKGAKFNSQEAKDAAEREMHLTFDREN
jgi:hypothetical protein